MMLTCRSVAFEFASDLWSRLEGLTLQKLCVNLPKLLTPV